MKKSSRPFLITIGIVILLWSVSRFTNLLKLYNIPTASNSPTINPGDRIMSSNLLKPKRFDFICIKVERPEGIKESRVYRLCGVEGDSVEIRSGFLFVNGDSADQQLTLTQEYYISNESLPEIEEGGYLGEGNYTMTPQGTVEIALPEKLVKEKGIKCQRKILDKFYVDNGIHERFGVRWNQDHFGPVVVPNGKYFLLGDNRHQCEDSRYLGFINESDFIGTVFGHR